MTRQYFPSLECPYNRCMTYALIAFAFINIVLGLVVTILWVRVNRPAKEDPRLSRGLQLLQSKISILEDLSDRTDRQVKQLVHILEERARGLSAKILKAEEMIANIEHSAAKSKQVAEIFQDKIPHEEIIERQNTAKYVQAAQLAHEGRTAAEIATALDIPESEAEFIVKVNKDELSFDREALPEWAQSDEEEKSAVEEKMVEQAFSPTVPDLSSIDRLTESFNKVVEDHREEERKEEEAIRQAEERRAQAEQKRRELMGKAKDNFNSVTKTVVERAGELLTEAHEQAKPVIKKVQFPRNDEGSV